MPITGRGWELHVKRLVLQTHARVTRTYASYQVHRDGVAVADLFGAPLRMQGTGRQRAQPGHKDQGGPLPAVDPFRPEIQDDRFFHDRLVGTDTRFDRARVSSCSALESGHSVQL